MQNSLPAIVQKVTTLVDGGLRLTVDTQELSPIQTSELFQLKGKLGHFVFAEQPIKEIDLAKLPPIKLEAGEKTPSERLRAALWVFWEQHKLTESFELFYRRQIDKYVESIKERLN